MVINCVGKTFEIMAWNYPDNFTLLEAGKLASKIGYRVAKREFKRDWEKYKKGHQKRKAARAIKKKKAKEIKNGKNKDLKENIVQQASNPEKQKEQPKRKRAWYQVLSWSVDDLDDYLKNNPQPPENPIKAMVKSWFEKEPTKLPPRIWMLNKDSSQEFSDSTINRKTLTSDTDAKVIEPEAVDCINGNDHCNSDSSLLAMEALVSLDYISNSSTYSINVKNLQSVTSEKWSIFRSLKKCTSSSTQKINEEQDSSRSKSRWRNFLGKLKIRTSKRSNVLTELSLQSCDRSYEDPKSNQHNKFDFKSSSVPFTSDDEKLFSHKSPSCRGESTTQTEPIGSRELTPGYNPKKVAQTQKTENQCLDLVCSDNKTANVCSASKDLIAGNNELVSKQLICGDNSNIATNIVSNNASNNADDKLSIDDYMKFSCTKNCENLTSYCENILDQKYMIESDSNISAELQKLFKTLDDEIEYYSENLKKDCNNISISEFDISVVEPLNIEQLSINEEASICTEKLKIVEAKVGNSVSENGEISRPNTNTSANSEHNPEQADLQDNVSQEFIRNSIGNEQVSTESSIQKQQIDRGIPSVMQLFSNFVENSINQLKKRADFTQNKGNWEGELGTLPEQLPNSIEKICVDNLKQQQQQQVILTGNTIESINSSSTSNVFVSAKGTTKVGSDTVVSESSDHPLNGAKQSADEKTEVMTNVSHECSANESKLNANGNIGLGNAITSIFNETCNKLSSMTFPVLFKKPLQDEASFTISEIDDKENRECDVITEEKRAEIQEQIKKSTAEFNIFLKEKTKPLEKYENLSYCLPNVIDESKLHPRIQAYQNDNNGFNNENVGYFTLLVASDREWEKERLKKEEATNRLPIQNCTLDGLDKAIKQGLNSYTSSNVISPNKRIISSCKEKKEVPECLLEGIKEVDNIIQLQEPLIERKVSEITNESYKSVPSTKSVSFKADCSIHSVSKSKSCTAGTSKSIKGPTDHAAKPLKSCLKKSFISPVSLDNKVNEQSSKEVGVASENVGVISVTSFHDKLPDQFDDVNHRESRAISKVPSGNCSVDHLPLDPEVVNKVPPGEYDSAVGTNKQLYNEPCSQQDSFRIVESLKIKKNTPPPPPPHGQLKKKPPPPPPQGQLKKKPPPLPPQGQLKKKPSPLPQPVTVTGCFPSEREYPICTGEQQSTPNKVDDECVTVNSLCSQNFSSKIVDCDEHKYDSAANDSSPDSIIDHPIANLNGLTPEESFDSETESIDYTYELDEFEIALPEWVREKRATKGESKLVKKLDHRLIKSQVDRNGVFVFGTPHYHDACPVWVVGPHSRLISEKEKANNKPIYKKKLPKRLKRIRKRIVWHRNRIAKSYSSQPHIRYRVIENAADNPYLAEGEHTFDAGYKKVGVNMYDFDMDEWLQSEQDVDAGDVVKVVPVANLDVNQERFWISLFSDLKTFAKIELNIKQKRPRFLLAVDECEIDQDKCIVDDMKIRGCSYLADEPKDEILLEKLLDDFYLEDFDPLAALKNGFMTKSEAERIMKVQELKKRGLKDTPEFEFLNDIIGETEEMVYSFDKNMPIEDAVAYATKVKSLAIVECRERHKLKLPPIDSEGVVVKFIKNMDKVLANVDSEITEFYIKGDLYDIALEEIVRDVQKGIRRKKMEEYRKRYEWRKKILWDV